MAVTAVAMALLVALPLAAPPAFIQALTAPRFTVEDSRGGKVFYSVPATQVEAVELEWIHSIEKAPWRERYVIDGDELVLSEVFLKSYGAGVPADLEGTTVNENGTVHTSGINRPIGQLHWVHSHATHHTLRVFLRGSPEPIVLDTEIPHHTFVTASATS